MKTIIFNIFEVYEDNGYTSNKHICYAETEELAKEICKNSFGYWKYSSYKRMIPVIETIDEMFPKP